MPRRPEQRAPRCRPDPCRRSRHLRAGERGAAWLIAGATLPFNWPGHPQPHLLGQLALTLVLPVLLVLTVGLAALWCGLVGDGIAAALSGRPVGELAEVERQVCVAAALWGGGSVLTGPLPPSWTTAWLVAGGLSLLHGLAPASALSRRPGVQIGPRVRD